MLFKKSDTFEIIRHLPKYLRVEKTGEVYALTMMKNDWDGNEDAYIIRYAKENQKNISTTNFLIEVFGRNIESAVYDMYLKVVELEKCDKIKGKTWIGAKSYEDDDLWTKQTPKPLTKISPVTTMFDQGTLFEEKTGNDAYDQEKQNG